MTSHASKTSPDSESSTTEDSTASFKSGVRSKDCGRGAHSHCKSELQKEESIKLAERMAEALARARSDPAAAAVAASAAKRQAPSSALAYLMHNNIMKRTLHTGGGSLAPLPDECRAPGGGIAYPRETKFIFDYRIRDPDEPDVFLDDTKKYGKRMELYSGKDFQIEFWEQCLGTMLIGEVASFLVPARCLVSFPAVNKKLRDYMLNKGGPGSAGGAPKHTCGFMSLREQGGLGYPDLDDLMTNPKTLEFIFELISVVLPSQARKETWIMTPEEKANTVPSLRKEGNDLYAAGKWFEAAAKYEEALGLLEQLLLREKPGEPEHVRIDLSRVPFRVNLAQCQFKLKDYYGAIKSTTEALASDPSNTKALFRRAMSYSAVGDLDLSESDFRKLVTLAPEVRATVDRELASLAAKRKACKEEERRRLAGKLFSPANDTSVS
uniref:AH receptor-interacting protein n=2 Tax=Schistocephalus solidus TaxID=70667 RepID=A0A0X3NUK5_SCHSO